MCGIAGVLNFNGAPVENGLISRMTRLLSHRGPDGSGTFVSGAVGLGHTRLAIIDLSETGRQPLFNDDGRLAIVYNGECYNHKALRAELEARGHRFRSTSDTEVVLRGYEEHGLAFVEKMIGMFAFAIWDGRREELVLCRDRVGIKPLYLWRDGARLAFASEIKPLLEAGAPTELAAAALSSYLSLRYVPGPATLFKGIEKLTPGTTLVFGRDGAFRRKTYWDLRSIAEKSRLSEDAAAKRFYDLLDESVGLCLESDVPVGAFLSGGLDSSAVTALMSRRRKDVDTFTVSIGGEADEAAQARELAASLGLTNTSLGLTAADLDRYNDAVWHLEEPIGDSIILPTFLLAREAAKKVKVVQIGEGADEILAGYVHQFVMTQGERLSPLARLVPGTLLAGLTKVMPQSVWDAVFPYPGKMGRQGVDRVLGYAGALGNPPRAYLELVGLFGQAQKRELLAGGLANAALATGEPEAAFTSYWKELKNPVFQNKLLELDLRYWNTDYTMLRIDKLTMASSLEARVPFLDHRLIELCLTLPAAFKTKGRERKHLMRQALAGKKLLPETTRRAAKTPFHLSPEKSFGAGFEAFINEVLSDAAVKKRGLFSAKTVSRLKARGSARELAESKQLMALAVFELWAKQYLDGAWRR